MNIQRTAIAWGEGKISNRLNPRLTLTVIVLLVSTLGASIALAQSVPFLNAPLVPGVEVPGSAAFTLTVNGTGFVSGEKVYWNGVAQATTFVSESQLTAAISAADIATAQTASVTVANPATGVPSNVDNFQVVKGGYAVGYNKSDYATDLTPQDVATADFSGNGILDLAVATGNNTVSVLMGMGDGTFPTHVEYPVPGHPSAIITGDFSGEIDIATVDPYTSEITILVGKGDGTFQPHQEYATGNHPVALATADVNGDGKLDIIVADYADNAVAVLLGNGDGTFQAHKEYPTGNGPLSVAIGDFNGDGILDLAVANNTDNTVAILLGKGDGSFGAPTAFATAGEPNSVVTGDFNGDGILDLAVGTSNKSVSVLLGNGNGTFQNHKEYTIGANAVEIAAADVNADGKLDLISANYNDNTVSVLPGNGDGTFKNEMVFPTSGSPTGIAIGDFNDDGKLDIAAVAYAANTVSVLLDGEITLSPSVTSFGKQTSGCTPVSKTVTLKNNGTTSYTVGTPSFVGAYTTDFTQTNTCGATLAAGKTCTYTVTFEPTASESANAQLLLTSSNGSVVGAQFTGSGNVPIELVPRVMTFKGYQLIGTTSAGQVDTFTNLSCVPITFTSIVNSGVNQNEFNITTTCPISPATLAGGASCTSTVTYTPNMSGAAHTTQIYYGDFTLAKQGLEISGNGTAVKVTPSSLTFPSTAVGSSSSLPVTFQNAGSVPLPITSINFVNGTANVFSETNTCNYPGGSVPANSSCTITVTFQPTSSGTATATMNIGNSDPTGPQMVSLSGTGTN